MNVIITEENHLIIHKGTIGRLVAKDLNRALISFDNLAFIFNYNDFKLCEDRCDICGAKKESHYEDHLCRLHKDKRGICTVCRKPFQKCVWNGLECRGMIVGGCSIDCVANDFF